MLSQPLNLVVGAVLFGAAGACTAGPAVASQAGTDELASSLYLPAGPYNPDATGCEQHRLASGGRVQTCTVADRWASGFHVQVVRTEFAADGWPARVSFSQVYAGPGLVAGTPEYGDWVLVRDPSDARRAQARCQVTGRVFGLDVWDDSSLTLRDE